MALHVKSTGIDFADFGHGTGTMTGELLDDYEEGGWLGYWTDGTRDASNTNQKYMRVGSLCQVDFSQAENWDDHSCTGNAHIKGLPYNTLNQGTGSMMLHRYVTVPVAGAHIAMFHGNATDQISPAWIRPGDSNLTFQFEHMNAGTAYDNYLGMSYITA